MAVVYINMICKMAPDGKSEIKANFNCALLTAYLLFAIPLLLPFKKLILVLMLNKAWRNSQSKAE